MATPRDLDNAVKYIKKLKKWLKEQQQPFNREMSTNVNRLNRKVFKRGPGGPAPVQPPPPPPFKP